MRWWPSASYHGPGKTETRAREGVTIQFWGPQRYVEYASRGVQKEPAEQQGDGVATEPISLHQMPWRCQSHWPVAGPRLVGSKSPSSQEQKPRLVCSVHGHSTHWGYSARLSRDGWTGVLSSRDTV